MGGTITGVESVMRAMVSGLHWSYSATSTAFAARLSVRRSFAPSTR
jgi:hypothetical protein